ncbi:MAG: SRPBCC family protein [Proteobacteria bacterium]|nr:SRPBCC family protein [Pseudomonadota bacterium]
MEHRLFTRTTFSLPVDRVFGFFADAANLEAITPPELRFRILTPLPIEMRVGAAIDYRLRLYGVPFRWRTEITHWEPGVRFVDEQRRGPYRKWVHEHRFAARGDECVMEDEVIWALPLAPFGEVARPLVRASLDRIFTYRRREIGRLLSEPPAGTSPSPTE